MKKIIKIAALILALLCIGTSLASCGSDSSIGGGLIPEADKSQTIGVGAKIHIFGKSHGEALKDFTIDKTTNSTEEFLTTLKNLYSPEFEWQTGSQDRYIFKNASVMEGNYLKIDLGRIDGYAPYSLYISITLPEKIKKVTFTYRQEYFWDKSEQTINTFGTISEDKKTFSFEGHYDSDPEDLKYGTLRIYY